MDIRTAMDEIVTLQEALDITAPITQTVAKAYKYFPPQNITLTDFPCFANEWTMVEELRDPSHGRQQTYIVHMQLFIKDADQERAADIATAYHVALVADLDASITLNGSVKQQVLRGGDPTLVVLERGGVSYVGLNLFLDVTLLDSVAFAA